MKKRLILYAFAIVFLIGGLFLVSEDIGIVHILIFGSGILFFVGRVISELKNKDTN